MKDDGIFTVFIIGFIVGAIVMGVGLFFSIAHADETQAVLHHAAHWEVSPSGDTTFKWNH